MVFLSWEFSADKPIFRQLVEILIRDIVSGKRASGEKMPTVRELALDAGVNPNTVQRAYNDIESRGLIVTRRGDGSYITNDKKLVSELSGICLDNAIAEFITDVRALGFDDETVIDRVKSRLAERKC